jgi:hypothetical protein
LSEDIFALIHGLLLILSKNQYFQIKSSRYQKMLHVQCTKNFKERNLIFSAH